MQLNVVLVFCVAVVFNALANILIKTSALPSSAKDEATGFMALVQTVLNPYFVAGLVAFGFALLGYKFVLGKGLKLSLAYPVFTSSGFILVLMASAYFFKEKLTVTQWIGIAFILIGVWLTALQMFEIES